MRSYAASRWEIYWKLRLPASTPYLFTALKIAATAAVVGTIIGEDPGGAADGLGRAIVNFNQQYITGPEKLWATILAASLLSALVVRRRLMTCSLMQQSHSGRFADARRPALPSASLGPYRTNLRHTPRLRRDPAAGRGEGRRHVRANRASRQRARVWSDRRSCRFRGLRARLVRRSGR